MSNYTDHAERFKKLAGADFEDLTMLDFMELHSMARDGDLIHVDDKPETRTVWVNLYDNGIAGSYNSSAEADDAAASWRIACKRVTFTTGEFDE